LPCPDPGSQPIVTRQACYCPCRARVNRRPRQSLGHQSPEECRIPFCVDLTGQIDNQGEVPYGARASFAGGDGSRTRHARPSPEACRNRAYERRAWRGSPRGEAWFGVAWLCLAGQGLAGWFGLGLSKPPPTPRPRTTTGQRDRTKGRGDPRPFSPWICSLISRVHLR
jgi:hypothetical protein